MRLHIISLVDPGRRPSRPLWTIAMTRSRRRNEIKVARDLHLVISGRSDSMDQYTKSWEAGDYLVKLQAKRPQNWFEDASAWRYLRDVHAKQVRRDPRK